jgi:hypothetical protein
MRNILAQKGKPAGKEDETRKIKRKAESKAAEKI